MADATAQTGNSPNNCPILIDTIIDNILGAFSSGWKICTLSRLEEPHYSWIWFLEYALWVTLLWAVIKAADAHYGRKVQASVGEGNEMIEMVYFQDRVGQRFE